VPVFVVFFQLRGIEEENHLVTRHFAVSSLRLEMIWVQAASLITSVVDRRPRRKGTNPSDVCKAMNTLHTAVIINLAVTLRSIWAGKNPTLTSFDRSILLLDVTQQIFFDVRLIEHLIARA
jgi:hypothetical protein